MRIIADPDHNGLYIVDPEWIEAGSTAGFEYPVPVPQLPYIVWNTVGSRFYEAGVDRGVLYPKVGPGVVWNGLISVNDNSPGGDPKAYYMDGEKYLNQLSSEEFSATIEAYTYPDEFAACDGTAYAGKGLFLDKQPRESFSLSYRTKIGNDLDGLNHGYKIHLVYNALASPSNRKYDTLDSSAKAMAFSWSMTTTPIAIEGRRATAHLIIDSTKTDPYLLRAFEEMLYGSDGVIPHLPSPQDVVDFFEDWVTLEIIDNGDGTWTANGPDEIIKHTSATEFNIIWPSAVPIDAESYTISSL